MSTKSMLPPISSRGKYMIT